MQPCPTCILLQPRWDVSLPWACGPPMGMKAHRQGLLIPNRVPRDFRRKVQWHDLKGDGKKNTSPSTGRQGAFGDILPRRSILKPGKPADVRYQPCISLRVMAYLVLFCAWCLAQPRAPYHS